MNLCLDLNDEEVDYFVFEFFGSNSYVKYRYLTLQAMLDLY